MQNRPRETKQTPNAAAVREEIVAPLTRLRRRWRLYAAVGGLVRVCLVIFVSSLLQLGLDRWLKLSLDQRAVLNACLTLLWLWAAYRYLIVVLVAPLPDSDMAIVVDRAIPAMHDQFATAVQFAEGQIGDEQSNSPALVQAVIQEARRDATRIPFLSVLNHRRAMRRLGQLGGQLAIVGLAFLLLPDLMGTWFKRNWLLDNLPWPQRTYLHAQGFDDSGRRRVPRGDEAQLLARIEGKIPTSAELIWKTPSGRMGREVMTLVGADLKSGAARTGDERFEASFGVLAEDIRFRLEGGDDRTREYVIEAVDRPQIVRTAARIIPPAYTRLKPIELERQTVFETLKNGSIEIDAWTNKPLATATFASADGNAGPSCEMVAPDHVRVRLADPVGGAYRFELTDRDGWKDRNPIKFVLKVIADKPPTARMELAGVGEMVTPEAELTVDLTYQDAYGLSQVEFLAERVAAAPGAKKLATKPTPSGEPGTGATSKPAADAGAQNRSEASDSAGNMGSTNRILSIVPEGFSPAPVGGTSGSDGTSGTGVVDEASKLTSGQAPKPEFKASLRFAVTQLGVAPGDLVRVWARAADTDPAGPNVGNSAAVELRVVTREDFLTEMSRREYALRQEFDRLVTSQKILNDSLERVIGELPSPAAPGAALVQRLAALSRQQDQQGRRCAAIRQHFEKIMAEMWTNKVAGAAVERRIMEGVVNPLGELARQRMPSAAAAILDLRSPSTRQKRDSVSAFQVELLRFMQSVLANMLRWEGYQEAVALLKEIIGEQSEVRTETMEAIKRELDDILELNEPAEPPKSGTGKTGNPGKP